MNGKAVDQFCQRGGKKMHESIGRYSIPRVNAGNFMNVIRHETTDT